MTVTRQDCFLASAATRRVPDGRLTPLHLFPFAAHPLSHLFLLCPFLEGLLEGTVLGNKDIGINGVTPALKKHREFPEE